MKLFLTVSSLIWTFLPVLISAQGSEALVTDRPDQTESASIVPSGHIQVELGVAYAFEDLGNLGSISGRTDVNPGEEIVLSLPALLVRVGVSETFELRLGGEFSDVKRDRSDYTEDFSGVGGLVLGGKAKVLDETGVIPQTALLVHLTLPYGNDKLSPERVTSDMRLSMAHTLSEDFGIGYNIGVESDAVGQLFGLYTLAVGTSISDQFGTFVELYGNAPWEDDAAHAFDAGFTWLLSDNIQLDISAGIGLTDAAVDNLLSTGVSVRFPD